MGRSAENTTRIQGNSLLKEWLKAVLKGTLPRHYDTLQQSLNQRRLRRVRMFLGQKYGLVVQSGPFAGMSYISEAICSSLVPKLLGSYESELHQVLNQILETDYQNVIDIGCAEGYYAVGLALRLPNARVYAMDVDSRARDLCITLAKANNVAERVVIEGACTHDRLNTLIKGRTLIICDCEGCELQLLDPRLAPGLKNTDR